MENGIDLNKFYQGLDDLFQQKDSGQTMAYLQRWLQEAQQRQDTSGIVAVSNELGGLCRAMGQIDRAKDLYKTVLTQLEHMGLTFRTLRNCTDQRGRCVRQFQRTAGGLQYFLRARDLLVECGLAGDYRMAALNNNISMVYRDTGEYRQGGAGA